MFIRFGFVGLVATACICPNGDFSPDGSCVLRQTTFEERFLDLFCQHADECKTDGSDDIPACLGILPETEVECEYDESNASICLSDLEDGATCDGDDVAVPGSCAQVLYNCVNP